MLTELCGDRGRWLLICWQYQQARQAVQNLDGDVVLALEWAILQLTGCLASDEVAAAPRFPHWPFRRARLPRWRREPDPVAEVNRELARERRARKERRLLLCESGHMTSPS